MEIWRAKDALFLFFAIINWSATYLIKHRYVLKTETAGYTRIITLGTRRGDNAQLAYLELTEKEEIVVKPKAPKAASKKSQTDATGHVKFTPAHKHLKVKPDSHVEATDAVVVDDAHQEEVKAKAKKDFVKDSKASHVTKDTAKQPGKGIVGNIKKMFNRKTAGGN